MASETIVIQFNGQSLQVADGTSIVELLQQMEVAGRVIAVEVNLEVVPREQHSQTLLRAGDVVEAVTLVGGG